jgi:hypothetical protein
MKERIAAASRHTVRVQKARSASQEDPARKASGRKRGLERRRIPAGIAKCEPDRRDGDDGHRVKSRSIPPPCLRAAADAIENAPLRAPPPVSRASAGLLGPSPPGPVSIEPLPEARLADPARCDGRYLEEKKFAKVPCSETRKAFGAGGTCLKGYRLAMACATIL